ncbi:MAG: hypothetical protein GQ559_11435 [Desulfobulbaceae bacterium]|nr:hypothetical protein [Desulfobulbaceae bacterium]
MQPESTPKNSLIFQYDFSIDTNEEKTIRASLHDLVRQAGYALRKRNLGCRTVAVQLHYIDGVQVTRQAICKTVATDDWALDRLAVTALYRGWHRRVRLRRLSLYCNCLVTPARQLSLFSLENKKQCNKKKISTSIDTIHELFGTASVMRASQLPTPET